MTIAGLESLKKMRGLLVFGEIGAYLWDEKTNTGRRITNVSPHPHPMILAYIVEYGDLSISVEWGDVIVDMPDADPDWARFAREVTEPA